MGIYVGNKRYAPYIGDKRREVRNKKALPYDAEIEYLESTGTQYIDTGINYRQIVSSTYKFLFPTSVPSGINAIYGIYYDNANIPRGQAIVYNGSWLGFNDSYFSTTGMPSGNPAENVVYEFTTKNKNIQQSDVTAYIFARNNDRDDYLPINNMRLYYFIMKNGDTVLRDFIPVRVGSTGYLYDRVSRQLFGNTGTGDFILGPDKN